MKVIGTILAASSKYAKTAYSFMTIKEQKGRQQRSTTGHQLANSTIPSAVLVFACPLAYRIVLQDGADVHITRQSQ